MNNRSEITIDEKIQDQSKSKSKPDVPEIQCRSDSKNSFMFTSCSVCSCARCPQMKNKTNTAAKTERWEVSKCHPFWFPKSQPNQKPHASAKSTT